jgi:sec-independent protein translocase protein TatA
MPSIGPMEIVIVLVIALLVVGPKKLPEMGRSLGTGMRSFRDSLTGGDDDRPAVEDHAAGDQRR